MEELGKEGASMTLIGSGLPLRCSCETAAFLILSDINLLRCLLQRKRLAKIFGRCLITLHIIPTAEPNVFELGGGVTL